MSAAGPSVPAMDEQAATDERPTLSDLDLAILELERSWWKHPGAKDATIRQRVGLSPTQYYAALNRLIDSPEAVAADPLVVKRLLRLRDSRRAQRSTRHVALDR